MQENGSNSTGDLAGWNKKLLEAETKAGCQHCGYCPHCGRSGYGTYPWYPAPCYPHWHWQQPYGTWTKFGPNT
jgi:hypothetical protein